MSTAILMSGQSRTLPQCLPTQHWHVYRHFPDRRFYVLWQNTQATASSQSAADCVKLLEAKYGKERVHAKLIDDPTDLPMIPTIHGAHAPYENAATHPQLLMQHWYQNEVWKFYLASPTAKETDTIIRMRADNRFHSCSLPAGLDTSTDYGCAFTPWWGKFGGVNDRFAIMDRSAAAGYFTVYENLQKLLDMGCPFHPESLTKAALELVGAHSIETLQTEFSTWRINGKHRAPEIMAPEIAYLAASSH